MKIALCGYLGSGCTEVAEVLASTFNLEVFNTSRILSSLGDLSSLSRSGEIDMDKIIRDKLMEILKGDNVIIEGRSAFMLLNRKDVIKIFLNAPFESRVKHVAERRGIPIEDARDDVARSDRDRETLVQRLHGKNLLDASNYDLVISTSSKPYSRIAEILVSVIENLLKE